MSTPVSFLSAAAAAATMIMIVVIIAAGIAEAGNPLPKRARKDLLPTELFNDTRPTMNSMRLPMMRKTRDGLGFALPLDQNTSRNISSPFGPRWKVSQTRYDLHTGIDFFNATNDRYNVYSIGTGQVYKISNSTSGGGLTVYVQHQLPHMKDAMNNNLKFHNRTIGDSNCPLYSVYLHLEYNSLASNIVVGQNLTRGQFIGVMGQTGDTSFTHLHLETRLCCYCSHSYTIGAHKTPTSTSECNCGFDTHVNPFSFLPSPGPAGGPISMEEIQPLNSSFRFAVRYNATRKDVSELDCIRAEIGTRTHVLNFNWRRGINTTSEASRDNWIHEYKPFLLVPGVFRSTDKKIFYDVHFPATHPKPTKIEFVSVSGAGIRWPRRTATNSAGSLVAFMVSVAILLVSLLTVF